MLDITVNLHDILVIGAYIVGIVAAIYLILVFSKTVKLLVSMNDLVKRYQPDLDVTLKEVSEAVSNVNDISSSVKNTVDATEETMGAIGGTLLNVSTKFLNKEKEENAGTASKVAGESLKIAGNFFSKLDKKSRNNDNVKTEEETVEKES